MKRAEVYTGIGIIVGIILMVMWAVKRVFESGGLAQVHEDFFGSEEEVKEAVSGPIKGTIDGLTVGLSESKLGQAIVENYEDNARIARDYLVGEQTNNPKLMGSLTRYHYWRSNPGYSYGEWVADSWYHTLRTLGL